ncbi:SpvB/TcaC N-terminal domain-containing protein [Pseudofrankia saprophytica]|uniref:SpvB/TcaC N-terminal domain-containing protein n=1 Tax=Pseudofrankia saprophytica TaxID=298655 RepID=UPI0018E35E5C|nr:SpvB/TcaC N-terminal domain-containing protein [Pseudofrankia saprophytica]
MSGESDGAAAVIALPLGGGAVRGLGEKFTPDPRTGTGNFSVPIAVPEGRNGLTPEVALAYSSGAGNGPLGLGWSLSVPGVTRRTSKGVPRYDDSRDVFLLSGVEDLVPVVDDREPAGAGGPTQAYRPRTEGLFARIEHRRTAGDDYWTVRSRDGLVNVYGTPGTAGHDPAVVADVDDPSRVFAWKLTRTVDQFGNLIEYTYRTVTTAGHGHAGTQTYLAEIHYADHGDPAAPLFVVTVRFGYEDRPDPFSEHRAGFEIRTTQRCRQIQVFTQADSDPVLVRDYQLRYADDPELARPTPRLSNGVSLLAQVVASGHDAAATETLPPLEFGYSAFEPERRDLIPVDGPDAPPFSLRRDGCDLADLTGDGLPDIVEIDPGPGARARFWRNLGGGRFDRPRRLPELPVGVALTGPGVRLLDADGDGRLDVLVGAPGSGLAGYFPLRFDGLFDRHGFRRYRQAPSVDLADPLVKLLDLTGDGVTDALRSGDRFECFFQDSRKGWTEVRHVERGDLATFPDVAFTDPRVKLADATGDGLTDIVLVSARSVAYWPNRGHGRWGRRVLMDDSPRLPFDFDPRRVLVGDVDGDGLADVVYVDDGSLTVWINRSGNGFSDPIEITGTPRLTDLDDVRLTDLLGTGVPGVLWTSDATRAARPDRLGRTGRPHMFFLDLTGGVKPYLLDSVDNHLGALTRVTYAPSTVFRQADDQRGREPGTRLQPPLPFPVQVVAKVAAVDVLSGGRLTTEYAYHHGYWDGVEREFRGFGRVDQRDTETFTAPRPGLAPASTAATATADGDAPGRSFSPPTETRTWFHLGALGDEDGGYVEADFTHESFGDDPPALPRPTDTAAMLAALPPRDRRDALRALRGRVLRTELYARDGGERADRPFTVTEAVYGLREEAPPTPIEDGRRRIFFPHLRAERTTQWERGVDPMTQVGFTDDYDSYGQPRAQTLIAVPRERDYRQGAATGAGAAPYLATHAESRYAQRDDAECYLVDRVARVTSYEVPNDGSDAVADLHAAISSGAAPRRIIGQTVSFYDGAPFQGRPFGLLGDYGVLARTETLVLTEEILHQAYGPELPPCLTVGVTSDPAAEGPVYPAEYPPEFTKLIPPLAGYVFRDGGDGPFARGYFAVTDRRRYDCHDVPAGQAAPSQAADGDATARGPVRGLLLARLDPRGRETVISHDAFGLLPVSATDPAGLVTTASNDYRVLRPRELTDPNGNRAAVSFTPLGFVAATALLGKPGRPDEPGGPGVPTGDTLEAPGTVHSYDLLAFSERGEPASVRTVRRVHHVTDTDIPLPERDETIETVSYFDGFGRVLQTRALAEEVDFGAPAFGGGVLPAEPSSPVDGPVVGASSGSRDEPRVAVTGRQVYDTKGRVVETFEPYFAAGFAYRRPGEAEDGQKSILCYDPRGHVVRTVDPDGSERRVVFGIPDDLSDPEKVTPTPWESYVYDANDNAGRTHPAEASAHRDHWDTPSSIEVDALGRSVRAVARNGPDAEHDWFTVRSAYDVRGNLLTVTDALGRVAFRYRYDLADQRLYDENIDYGVRRQVLDATGAPVERRDAKGALQLYARDVLNRPVLRWARDAGSEPVTLRNYTIYGDSVESGVKPGDARVANLLGRPLLTLDEAGATTADGYDFKGNVLATTRQVVADRLLVGAAPDGGGRPPFRVDWQPAVTDLAGTTADLLDPRRYQCSTGYDALNRPTSVRYPEDADGRRRELTSRYHPSGAPRGVSLDGETIVERVAHDVRGQRALIAYGNGLLTRYAYDPRTFRLSRLRTERYRNLGPAAYQPAGTPLQDYAYSYDLAGNIVALRDRTPGCGIAPTADALDRLFTYDPLYRLTSATGRECDLSPPAPFDAAPRCADLSRTRAYTQSFAYDADGNLVRLTHANAAGGFVRAMAIVGGSNRLAAMTSGKTTFDYGYDAAGNLINETASRHFEWDAVDRMRSFRVQAPGAAEPSLHATYLYDGAGQRVKKVVRKGGRLETTVYIGGIFEHQTVAQPAGATVENTTLHVSVGTTRVAEIRVGPAFDDDRTPPVKYHLPDHLGSNAVVVDAGGGLISREEFTPYGETSFGGHARKRYRFTGRERDEESGLGYHAARYYAPWLARWTSCDPAGAVDGPNLYRYVAGNPIRATDRGGTEGEDETGIKSTVARPCNCSQVPDKPKQTTQPPTSTPPTTNIVTLSGPGLLIPGLEKKTFLSYPPTTTARPTPAAAAAPAGKPPPAKQPAALPIPFAEAPAPSLLEKFALPTLSLGGAGPVPPGAPVVASGSPGGPGPASASGPSASKVTGGISTALTIAGGQGPAQTWLYQFGAELADTAPEVAKSDLATIKGAYGVVNVASGVLGGISTGLNSPNTTTGGKVGSGVVAGGASIAVGLTGVGTVAMAGDAGIKFAFGVDLGLNSGISFLADGSTALVESLFTDDMSARQEIDRRAAEGEYGLIMEGAYAFGGWVSSFW